MRRRRVLLGVGVLALLGACGVALWLTLPKPATGDRPTATVTVLKPK